MGDKNLYQRLSAVMKDVETLPKNGYNERSNYKYVLSEDVIDHTRNLLVKHGVFLKVDEKLERRERDGKNLHSIMNCVAYFINIDKPDEQISIPFTAIGTDTLDKDILKGKTSAIKHLLKTTFFIIAEDFDRNSLLSSIKNLLYLLTDGFQDKDCLADIYSHLGLQGFEQLEGLDNNNLKSIQRKLEARV